MKTYRPKRLLGAVATTAAALAVFVCGGPVKAQEAEALPQWVKADWEYWTQGTGRWIADNAKYKAENEPFDAYGTEWKWGLGKKSLKGRLFAVKDGKEVGTIWEFHSYWHPKEKKVVQTQFGADGTYATGSMHATGENKTEALQRFFGADGSTFQVGHRAELRATEVLMQSYDVSESGEWKARRYYVWKLQGQASGAAAQSVPAGGRLIDVDGHRLFIHCIGSGTPTVIIDGGAGVWSLHYRHIQQELAATTRVCTYDRAGLGRSDAGPRPRTSAQMAEELHRLLHGGGIAPPVILAGHSLGGYNVRIYQDRYPEEVAALVLIDSGHEKQWERLPQEVRQLVTGAGPFIRARGEMARNKKLTAEDVKADVIKVLSAEQRAEHEAALLTPKPYEGQADVMESAMVSASQVPRGASLANLPLIVLTATNSFAAFEGTGIPVAEANRVWLDLQKDLTSLSKRSTQLFSESTHNLHETDPRAIASAITMAIDQVRRRPPPFAALGAPARMLPAQSTAEVDGLLAKLESAYNAMDAEAFTSLFTEDATQLDVNRRVHVRGRSAWTAWTKQVNAAHSKMLRRHAGRARMGDWVIVEIEWSGTVRGEAVGSSADREYRFTGLGLLRIIKGRVHQQILYGDYASLLEQLRAAPTTP